MSEPFDPYYLWLGIPPRDQPPNHYRLLAIELFEGNPTVIASAADQRMAHLRTYQLGQHVEWSQKLLNEVAAAKVCLLDSEKKAAYDAMLRRAVFQAGTASAQQAAPPVIVAGTRSNNRPVAARRSRQPLIGTLVVAVLLLAAATVWMVGRQEDGSTTIAATKPATKEQEPLTPPTPSIPTVEIARPTAEPEPSPARSAESTVAAAALPASVSSEPPKAQVASVVPGNASAPPSTGAASVPAPEPVPALPHTLESHFVNWITFNRDGSLMATAGNDCIVQIRDGRTGLLLHSSRQHREQVRQAAFSPDGKTLVTVSFDQTIKFWDPTTGAVLRSIDAHDDRIQCVAFSPDGRLIATGANDRKILIHGAAEGKLFRTLSDHVGPVRSVAFSPDGTVLASGAGDGYVKLWDVTTWQCRSTLAGHPTLVACVAFSPNGSRIAAICGNGAIRIWDVATGRLLQSPAGHDRVAYSIAWSPDGRCLATASMDRTVKLWNPDDGSLLRTLDEHNDEVYAVAFTPDGKVLLSGGKDNMIRCWQLADILPAAGLETAPVSVPAPVHAGDKPKKVGVPSEEVQAQIARRSDELSKLADLRAPDEKVRAAKDLLLRGQQMNVNVDERFVFLRKTAELACEAGDVQLMLAAVESLRADFEVDTLAIKEKLLAKVALNGGDATAIQSFVDGSRHVIEEALGADRLEVAESVAELGYRACQRPAGQKLRKDFLPYRAKVQKARSLWSAYREATKTLETDPADERANLTVGYWFWFAKDDWKHAAEFFANGSDQTLKAIVARELAGPPAKPEDKVELGDAWWTLAMSRKGDEKAAMQARAADWYQQAVNDLERGPTRTRIENRLAATTAANSTGTGLSAAPGGDVGRMAGKVIPESIDAELRLPRKSGPYKLMTPVTITSTGALYIERGATVLCAVGSKIIVEGRLASFGEEDDFVRFRPATSYGWDTILVPRGQEQLIERFDVRGAAIGLHIAGNGPQRVQDCIFVRNKIGVKADTGGGPSFRNCIIANNLGDGVQLHGHGVTLDHCSIANNGGVGIHMTYYGSPMVSASEIRGNRIGIKSSIYETKPVITSSNIVDNQVTAEVRTNENFSCAGCYWGAEQATVIAASIIDGRRKPGGLVVFEPFEKKPVRDAGCTLKVPKER